MPVRVGVPNYSGGLSEVVRNPRYSTGVGLLISGLEQMKRDQHVRMQVGSLNQLVERMKKWFTGNF
jgi:cell division protein FtsA